jgi:hypothetical protein
MFSLNSNLKKKKVWRLLVDSYRGFSCTELNLYVGLIVVVLIDLILCYSNFTRNNQIKHNATRAAFPTRVDGFVEFVEWKIEIKSLILPITGQMQEWLADGLYVYLISPIQHFFNPKILANCVTLFYVLISIPEIWLLANTANSCGRKVACGLFQLKNVLDYVDGKIIRNGSRRVTSETDSNKHGQLIDATGNVVSLLCFFVGSFIYIWKCKKRQNQAMMHSGVFSSNTMRVEITRNRIVLVNVALFLIYFIVASAGWNMVLANYVHLVSNQKVTRPPSVSSINSTLTIPLSES